MVLLCGGARSGPGDGAPNSRIEAFLSRSESGRKGLLEAASRPFLSDVRHADTARRPRQRDRSVSRGPKAEERACSRLLHKLVYGVRKRR